MTEEEKAFKIIEKLCNKGCNAYLTGGAVRDLFMGKDPNDYDIATEATPDQIELFFSNVNTVGKSFEVCLVNKIEVAGYRKDTYFGYSDKNCQIEPAMTIEEDLARRDFTINSMAFCPHTSELIDPYNGMQDLENKIIKFTGNPKDRIYEDPCRIVRACRFIGLINGKFDKETFNALKEYSCLLEYVSKERLRLEIFKALKMRNTSIFFKALHDIGGLQYVFPSLEKCVNHTGGEHHNETIFEHNMIVGDVINCKCPLVKLAGYLHDIGKPDSFDSGKFLNHEKIGVDILRDELYNLRFSRKEIDYICNLISLHMHSINVGPKGIRKLIRKITEKGIHYRDWIRIKFADSTGNLKKGSYSIDVKKNIIENIESEIYQENNIFDIRKLAINGNDVMNVLNIPSGPEVGEKLKELYEIVLENPELNSKDELIKLLY